MVRVGGVPANRPIYVITASGDEPNPLGLMAATLPPHPPTYEQALACPTTFAELPSPPRRILPPVSGAAPECAAARAGGLPSRWHDRRRAFIHRNTRSSPSSPPRWTTRQRRILIYSLIFAFFILPVFIFFIIMIAMSH